MDKIIVPPIKIQGKKTQLIEWLNTCINLDDEQLYIEPFMGSGVVGINIAKKKALFADSNPHIINFYNEVKNGTINPSIVKDFLEKEGQKLSEFGVEHFKFIRDRFNAEGNPIDFLFLNRSCFNGMIRFNKSFKFNVPYGHKPERFAQAYITKITNQIKYVQGLIEMNDWEFKCQDFRKTLSEANSDSFIYCDPPYIGRHVDYYDSWTEEDEFDLKKYLEATNCNFGISTWHSNSYRRNEYLQTLWSDYNIATTQHFYHVGANESNRNEVLEALITNCEVSEELFIKKSKSEKTVLQLELF
jgi:DNA adenine methylase